MIMALLIYLGAHTGAIVASPLVINGLAIGSVVSSTGICIINGTTINDGYYYESTKVTAGSCK